MQEETGKLPPVGWASVATFYAIACAVSWPLFWWRDMERVSWEAWAVPPLLKSLTPAAGPALGAVVALLLFRRSHPRTVTPGGTSSFGSVLFAALPVALLTALAVRSGEALLESLGLALAFAAYGFGEELGWRGFLQDALRPLPKAPRILAIAALWGAWHFTTFLGGGIGAAAPRLAAMSVVWVLGSWGLGEATDRTRSVLVAAMLHVAFNVPRSLPREIALPFLAGSAVIWAVLFAKWPKADATAVPAGS